MGFLVFIFYFFSFFEEEKWKQLCDWQDLDLWPGIEPMPRQWKHQVLTTGPPGNSQLFFLTYTTWVKNLPPMQETWVRSLGQEDPLAEGMPTHSSILVWRILWTEEPGGW